jgi:hypothetical protein
MRNTRTDRRHDNGPISQKEVDLLLSERMYRIWLVAATVSIVLLAAHIFWPAFEALWRISLRL